MDVKIGVVSSTVFLCPPPGYAGLENISFHCAKGLAQRGHEVTLFAPSGSYCPGCRVVEFGPAGQINDEMAYGGFPFKDASGHEQRYGGYWPTLLEFNGGGVIVDHSWGKHSAMLKVEGRLKAPVLVICHAPVNTMFSSPPPEGVSPVCISEDQKNHYEALHSPRKARVCHNGIDLDFYRPLGTGRTDRFLFLARFSSIKGPDLAIEACKKAGVGLDLVGDTGITGEPHVFEHCKRMADGKQIKIIGPCSRGETVWWYSRAHVLLHPTGDRFREPFGLAPVEAQACGCPVISFDYGALRETVVHGKTGWLANNTDEFVELVRKSWGGIGHGINEQMRANCREWASKFSVANMVKRYEELCEEALRKPW